MKIRICLALVALAAIGACSVARTDAVDSSSANIDGAVLPCDVDAVLGASCRGCHASPPRFGAPMSLVTYADLVAPAVSDPSRKVYEMVHDRVHEDTRPMPPPPNARLTAEATGVIDRWFASGAPATTASCDGGVPVPPAPTLSCTPDLHLAPPTAWSMPDATDDAYVCYGFDVTTTAKRHVVGIAPRIDNPAIVHHLVLFQSDEALSPTPTICSSSTATKWHTVYAWAPGGRAFEFPPEAGYPQENTTHYVMQIHYNNILHRPGQTDASGMDFCTTDQLRPNDADTLTFGPHVFQIPPRATTDLSCDVKLPSVVGGPLHAFAAFPHMHQHGASIDTKRLASATVPEEDLGGRDTWDFQNQFYLPVDGTLEAGDTVRTRCVWKNAGDTTISFGETSEDEMCFSWTLYWPRITAPQWTWASVPLLTHCHPTPDATNPGTDASADGAGF